MTDGFFWAMAIFSHFFGITSVADSTVKMKKGFELTDYKRAFNSAMIFGIMFTWAWVIAG